MAPPQATASPTPGPSSGSPQNRIADALYSWCAENHEEGHVFTQQELLDSEIVPNRDLQILLEAVTYLCARSLFKQHELKNSSAVAWAVVSRTRAANYDGLTRDERMVFAAIDNAGNKGMWVKQIKARMAAHQKVLEKVFKSLEAKGRIVPIKDVKFPQRKVYMVKGLTPSTESTGGAWYTEGDLDQGMLRIVSDVVERFVSERSWNRVETPAAMNNKRKTPHDGFEVGDEARHKSAKNYEIPAPIEINETPTSNKNKRKASDAGFDAENTSKSKSVKIDDSQLANKTKKKSANDSLNVKGKSKSKSVTIDDDQPRSVSPELNHKAKNSRSREIEAPSANNKRKAPHDDFDVKDKGKSKSIKVDDNQPRSISPELKHKNRPKSTTSTTYLPHAAGYQGYPTLQEITHHITTSKITNPLPTTAISQLVQTMIYDDRLFAMRRPVHGGETADDPDTDTITMYRCFRTPPDAQKRMNALMKAQDIEDNLSRKDLPRWLQLEDLGRGGSSEVPCLACPAFEYCGDGGPVNIRTCPYFDEWFVEAIKADQEAGDLWPGGDSLIKIGEAKKLKRERALAAVEVKIEQPEVLEVA